MNQTIKTLKTQCELFKSDESIITRRKYIEEALDYIQRLENLVTAQNALIDSNNLGVKCNDCPFIEGCIFQEGKVNDCQLRMANRGKELSHIL